MNANLPPSAPGPAPVAQVPQTFDDELTLRELADIISADRWLLIATVALAFAAGLFYVWAATPTYKADALIQVEKKKQSVLGSSDDIYDMLTGRTETSTEIELLKSRLVLGNVVTQLQLDVVATPRHFPLIGGALARRFKPAEGSPVAGAFLGLRNYAWGGERIEVGTFDVPAVAVDKAFTLRAGADGTYNLEFGGRTLGQGRVGEPFEFNTPHGAGRLFVRDLAAAPGTRFQLVRRHPMRVMRSLASSLQVKEQGRLSGMLGLSLEGPDAKQVAKILNAIATTYQRQNVERRSAEAEQTLAFVNEQLPRVQKELEAAENALNRYRLQQKSADLTKETELVLQQAVALEESRQGLQQKREEMLRRFTASHPAIEAIDAQLAQVAGEQAGLATRVKGLPETQQELLRLSRDIEVNSKLYTSLLNSAEQLQITKAGVIGNVRIVDYALEPFERAKPAKAQTLALSLVAGGFLGLVAIFVRRALRAGVEDPAVLERGLNLQTHAAIPYTPAQRKLGRKLARGETTDGLLVRIEPDNPATEAIRSLRTALHVTLMDAGNNVLMICGPSPELGKSFVTVNLAASLAMTGRRVAVVDADLRRGHLHQFLSLSREPGLSDFINGKCELDKIVHATSLSNLFLVPTGSIPPNPSELLLNERFEQAIKQVSGMFDFVIMDSAPVLAVTDAMIVGRVAGTTLMVIKAGQHPLRELEDTVRRLKTGGVPVHGVVLNQVGRQATGRYGYKSGYYSYKYQAGSRGPQA